MDDIICDNHKVRRKMVAIETFDNEVEYQCPLCGRIKYVKQK